MQYLAAYQFVFQSPNWLVNLLLGTVCHLIPIVGPIVLLGYEYELIEALHRDPRRIYPDFDFGRFGEYLNRGVWPFLVSLIVSVVVVPLVYVMMFLCMALLVAVPDDAPFVALLGFVLIFVCFLALSCFLALAMTPLLLRAGLAQDFAAVFDFGFFKNFFRLVWTEEILATLFLMATGLILGFVGMALCCVGIYPAATLTTLAHAHLLHQLYELYLRRGGQPIPLKEPAGILPA